MSGFKDDVISILRQNSMLQREGVGLVLLNGNDSVDLFDAITEMKFPVLNKRTKPFVNFDYVVIPKGYHLENLLYAFSAVSTGGIIIVEANNAIWDEHYVSRAYNFTGTRVRYEDRFYMVIHAGVDYGD
jgi:hypothetical protein